MAMEILIMRHGDAVDDAPRLGDGGRWLTGKGRRLTRQVANWLCLREDTRPVEIWTSPLVRAVQTAEILAGAAELHDEVSVAPDLAIGGSLNDVMRSLARHGASLGGPIALVGHEPSLSELAVALLGSRRWPGFKKSGVAVVGWSGHGLGTFRFLLEPKDLRVVTEL
jgi:phosphohistidine phosphatase